MVIINYALYYYFITFFQKKVMRFFYFSTFFSLNQGITLHKTHETLGYITGISSFVAYASNYHRKIRISEHVKRKTSEYTEKKIGFPNAKIKIMDNKNGTVQIDSRFALLEGS